MPQTLHSHQGKHQERGGEPLFHRLHPLCSASDIAWHLQVKTAAHQHTAARTAGHFARTHLSLLAAGKYISPRSHHTQRSFVHHGGSSVGE